ncbi:MAG TPA: glycoside hydrolase family 18 protein [Cellvibrionaceae bacterium]
MKKYYCILLLTSLWLFSAGTAASPAKVIIGYVFEPENPLDPDTIAAEKLTHINYAFSNIKDGKLVEGFAFDADNYRLLQSLKKRNPELKILTSVGGWTWSGGFSDMVLTEQSRQRFIDSAIDFARRHQLDGIDLDWEYPGLAGAGNTHRPEDGENYTLLLRDLRAALDKLEQELGRPLLLTIASAGFPDFLHKSDMGNWQRYLDYINVMAYDNNFPSEGGTTGHHTALYSFADDTSGQSAMSAIQNHLDAGVPVEKLVLGVAFYGRHWTDVSAGDNHGLGQPGSPGESTFGGTRYNNIAPNLVNAAGFTRHWDPVAQAPWLWHAKEGVFISYDDPESLTAKAAFIKEKNLAGAMFWQYSSDYKNQLLDVLYQKLR